MKWFLLILILAVIVVGCDSQARTMIIEGGVSSGGGENDTNETIRVEAIVNTSCTAGNFIYTFLDNGTGVCDAPSGSGDITSIVNDSSGYITGGAASGDVVIGFNESILNGTIDARDTNCTADGSCSLIVYEGDENRLKLSYENITSIPNCSSDEEYLTMINGVLSCDADDIGSDTQLSEAHVEAYVFNDEGNFTDLLDDNYYPLGSNPYNYTNTTSDGGGTNESIFFSKTTSSINADLSVAGYTGYEAGNYLCNANFTGTHLCTQYEIITTYYLKNVSTIGEWSGSGWTIGASAKYLGAGVKHVNDCNGFTDDGSSGDYFGNAWSFSQNKGLAGTCDSLIPLLCCKVW